MPELGSYGSVRGARGNSRPYRESSVSGPSGPVLTRNELAPIEATKCVRAPLLPIRL